MVSNVCTYLNYFINFNIFYINLSKDVRHSNGVCQQPIGSTDLAVCSVCVPTARVCPVWYSSHVNCFY